MKLKTWRLLVLFAGLFPALLAADEARQLRLRWSEIGPATAGAKVAMVLPSGTHVEGKVLSAEAAGLRMRVSKTSDRKEVAKGERVIPRQSISTLRVTRYNKTARIVCTLGAIAAAGLVIAAQDIDVYEGPAIIIVPTVAVLGTAGAAVGGYFIGKRMDRRITDIVVEREGVPE